MRSDPRSREAGSWALEERSSTPLISIRELPITSPQFAGRLRRIIDVNDVLSSRNKVKRCEAAIEAYRDEIDTRKAENYGFASMAAVPYAHIVARMLEGKNPRGTTVSLAPNPKDLVCSFPLFAYTKSLKEYS